MEKKDVEADKSLDAVFFETAAGNQPVREFILGLTREDRKEVGADIRTVQRGFPLGLPLVRKIKPNLWEVRSVIRDGICRVFFTIHEDKIILLHGFVKKTQKTPPKEFDIVVARMKDFKKLIKEYPESLRRKKL
jgi:phage-related protein